MIHPVLNVLMINIDFLYRELQQLRDQAILREQHIRELQMREQQQKQLIRDNQIMQQQQRERELMHLRWVAQV